MPDFIPMMLKTMHETVSDFYGYLQNPQLLQMVVLTRNIDKRKSMWKMGFHVSFPNITVDLDAIAKIRSVCYFISSS